MTNRKPRKMRGETVANVVQCDYCRYAAPLMTGEVVYPHRKDLAKLNFYRCDPCDAQVGCHRGTIKPLGRLANKELRSHKSLAHAAFDVIWKDGHMTRTEAYAWLADMIGVIPSKCHMGMFDVNKCQRVVRYSELYIHELLAHELSKLDDGERP